MTELHVFPIVQEMAVDLLAEVLAAREPNVRVGNALPPTFDSKSTFVLVDGDGAAREVWPVFTRQTIRLTAWVGHEVPGTVSRSQNLVLLCQGLMLMYDGTGDLNHIKPGSGLITAKDPRTKANLASVTVLAGARSTVVG